uniref:Uncharacterized protein n=1 Tax=Brassica oleracea TaxID=3712 RepID=A0A3P6GHI3_BRAOL|nr:unnamed protein product [Brassica oleracea]
MTTDYFLTNFHLSHQTLTLTTTMPLPPVVFRRGLVDSWRRERAKPKLLGLREP